ncbi:MAG: dephospho-CoA kinase [Clostridia bacterium]|nr:dephospho-CoA kinase [Clostridia bacterium]
MHISITGKLGSGKSTICNLIKEKYGYEIFSTGAIQREVARSMGITTLELNQRMKLDHSLDDTIDATTTRLSRERRDDKLIFDSRMAWHFAEHTFKIFLTVDPKVAAARVMANQRGDEERYASVDEACEKLVERSRVEQARFIELYGVDYYDFNNYNLVIDSSCRTPDEIVSLIWSAFEAYQADEQANVHKEYL